MTPRRCLLALTLVAVAAIPVATAAAAARGVDTTSALRGAGWGDNVRVGFSGGKIDWRSNGLPNTKLPAEYAFPNPGVSIPNATNSHIEPTAAVVKPQDYDYRISTAPRLARKKTTITIGPIGVMISGALIFNPFEADGTTIATNSNFTLKNAAGQDVAFVDSCNGHPTPDGHYHYHGLPGCVTAQVDRRGGPSHIIGLAWDGFPIYGDRDIEGRRVTGRQLDGCNGLTSATPEFPKGIYHYVLLNVPTAQSAPRCLRGTPGEGLPVVTQAPPPGISRLTAGSVALCDLAFADRAGPLVVER